ncbi:MAG: acyl-CoA dehydrogenase family protein, partial [Planctomycetes bacterium]|nr:acyl-CoA dehydrogenase family protein [Planctomycetota bacterium]
DPSTQEEVQHHLEALGKVAASASPRRLDKGIQQLEALLQKTVLARPVLKMLCHRFLESWRSVVQAAAQHDLVALPARLQEACAAWQQACARAADLHAELGRRREAGELFLRWVAAGQISAFALTEPSAGSDTARVATRAHLRSVPVEAGPDGVYQFIPEGGKEPRWLLDAGRLEFRAHTAYYRWSDTAEPAPIRFDEYDYETDNPSRMRYLDLGGRRVHFTDIAQLRSRDGKLWYDYWELTGAKMWITNGRMAGIMCLYAKTAEGVTGFIVDRHAEGLVVGKDEAKMGQCGSPTNELSLQAVRVPRENVIGLEGRGQVNALETLNVGRAGLAMSAMSHMEGLVANSRAFAREIQGELPGWVRWRLERMEEERFIAEAVAYEVIGRFEHPQTRSIRLESAVAKMLVSELYHHLIELAEEVYGLAGQTQLYLLEKRKRDARILTIYEGTNEIQRFFILKDLATEVAPRWASPGAAPQHVGREALELEALRGNVRQRVQAALALFGRNLWENPNLQANCFLLSEATAWLKAADSTLGRLAWLSRQAQADENAEPSPRIELARRALARAIEAVRDRVRRFDEELSHLRRGFYAPEVRAASLLFHEPRRAAPKSSVPAPWPVATLPCRVLVIVDPSAGKVPQPQVAKGRLLEPHFTLTSADRSALEAAFRLREESASPVALEVACVGPRGMAQALREALSLGADKVRLVLPEVEAVTPDSAARALAALLGTSPRYEVVLGGSGPGEEGLTAKLTAEALGLPHAGTTAQLEWQAAESETMVQLRSADGSRRLRSLPLAVAVEAEMPLRPFTIAGYLAGLSRTVEVHRWPKQVPARRVLFLPGARGAAPLAKEESTAPLSPEEAAQRLLEQLGQGGSHSVPPPYEKSLEDVPHPDLLEADSSSGSLLAVLAAAPEGRLQPSAATVLRAAERLALSLGLVRKVLLVVPPQESVQRLALGQLLEEFQGDVVVLATSAAAAPPEVESRLLVECWPELTR